MKAAIIPVYNDGGGVEELVQGALRHVDHVVVVDDGSDEPVTVARDGCIVLTHYENLGKGAALRTALSYLRYTPMESVVLLDGDGEHDPAQIPAILDGLREAPVVLGFRDRHRSLKRKVVNAWMSFWFRLLHPEARDPSCGMRGFRSEALDGFEIETDDFRVDAEIVLRAVARGLKIKAVPVSVAPSKESSVSFEDFLGINNYFDDWVLENAKNLKLGPVRRRVLLGGARIGKYVGETLHGWIS